MYSIARWLPVATLLMLAGCGPPVVFLSDEINARAAAIEFTPGPQLTATPGIRTDGAASASPGPETGDPVITALQPTNGGPGSIVEITGRGFEAPVNEFLLVAFDGAFSPFVSRISSTRLRAVVPLGAKSGNVSVLAATKASEGVPFRIFESFSLVPGDKELPAGSNATFSYKVAAGDGEGEIASPSVQWSVAGEGVTVDGNGMVVPVGIGNATLKVSSGLVFRTARISVFRIEGVTIVTPHLSLYAPPANATPAPGFQTSGRLTARVKATDRDDRRVAWSSSATEQVAVSPEGAVTVAPGAPETTVIVTATSLDDPSKWATASVQVTRETALEVEVR